MSDEQRAAIERLRKDDYEGEADCTAVVRQCYDDMRAVVLLYLAEHPEPPVRPVLEAGPNSYVGWKVAGQYPDGSLLLDGPTGERRHVWFLAQPESK
jgi:hypothetical protein